MVFRPKKKYEHGATATVVGLGEFLGAYLETAVWASTDARGNPLDRKFSASDFTQAAVAEAARDAERFIAENAVAIESWGESWIEAYEQAGHDFWLTRNGEGAGFWDGDWPEPEATTLTRAAKRFPERNVEAYRGKLTFV